MTHEILTSKPMRDAQTLTRAAVRRARRRLRHARACVRPGSRIRTSPDRTTRCPTATSRSWKARSACWAWSASSSCSRASTAPTTAACSMRWTWPGPAPAASRWWTDEVPEANCAPMHARGVRALRLDLFLRSSLPTVADLHRLHRAQHPAHPPLGWHVQFYTPGWVVRDLIPFLPELESRLRDRPHGLHAGKRRPHARRTSTACCAPCRRRPRLVQALGPVPAGQGRQLRAAAAAREAIVEAVPDRVIWGSDWPHIPEGGRDTGELLNLLADWIPDAARTQDPGRQPGPPVRLLSLHERPSRSAPLMHCIQELDTSGARAAESCPRGHALPRGAATRADVAGQPAQMTLGNSDIPRRWSTAGRRGRFVPCTRACRCRAARTPSSSASATRAFLATASLRTGAEPLRPEHALDDLRTGDGEFETFQQHPDVSPPSSGSISHRRARISSRSRRA
jgi:2-pyrone-4,6-dicarboxylate lactonase